MPPPLGATGPRRTGGSGGGGNSDISLTMSREYKKVKPKGKISEIIDFHIHGRNRYMVINQSRAGSQQKLRGLGPGPTLAGMRNPAKFRNPLLNKYEHDGDDDYERKRYIFEDDDDDENAAAPDSSKDGKTKGGRRKKRLSKTLKQNKEAPKNGKYKRTIFRRTFLKGFRINSRV